MVKTLSSPVETPAERSDLRTWRVRGGEGGMQGDRRLEAYALPCVTQPASGNWPRDSGNSNRPCDNLEGRAGREAGSGGGDVRVLRADSC